MEKKKDFKDGYLSFTAEEIRESATNDNLNAEAYEWLDKAMTTSSNVKKRNKKGESVDIDDVYPVTAEETEQMRECLDRAQERVKDPNDTTFRERLGELRDIVDWSSKRHRTFQWILIAGVLVTLGFVYWIGSDSESQVAASERNKATVEAWIEQDTTIMFDEIKVAKRGINYTSANSYKHQKLSNIKHNIEGSEKVEKELRFSADTASTEKRKEIYLKRAEQSVESRESARAEYDEINELEFKQIKKMAYDETKRRLKSNRAFARKIFMWTMFFVILIPLYIFSQRPYGYMITRMRLESKVLGGIQKLFFGMAAGMATGAFAMNFLPETVVKWSDGTTTKEGNAANYVILVFKICLYGLALFIFCLISCLLMIYMTAQGLRRNYNWSPALAKAQEVANGTISKKSKRE